MHLVASTTTWYAARAGGVVGYLLVSASVLAGILLAGKRRVPGLPRFAVEDVHRFLGLLAGVFIVVHVGAVALDSVVPFSLTQLLVPFTADYRPLATGLGIVALELLLAVSVTNRLRSRLPYRVWRRAHYATLAVWLLATVHGILSGTDRDQAWLLWIYAVTVAAVAGAAALRFGRAPGAKRYAAGLAVAGGGLVVALGLAAVPQPASTAKGAVRTATVSVPALSGELTGTIDSSDSEIVSINGSRGVGDLPNRSPPERWSGDRQRAPDALRERKALRRIPDRSRHVRLLGHLRAPGRPDGHGARRLGRRRFDRHRHALDGRRDNGRLTAGATLSPARPGEVAERSNAAVSKTVTGR